MADNTTLNPGAGGDVIATEDFSGVKIQRVKMVLGTKDTNDDGDISSTNPIPVVAGGGNPVEVDVAKMAGGSVSMNSGNVDNGTQRVVLCANQAAALSSSLPVTIGANSSVNASQVGGNTINTAIGNTGAGTQRVVLASDQPNVPVTGVVTANAGTGTYLENLTQISGNNANTNSGNSSNGTLRVVIATDQPAFANSMPVTIGANSSVNVNQVAGTTVDTNSGNKSAGTQRIVIATDQPALANSLPVTIGANSSINLSQVLGNTVGTAKTGVAQVGIMGSTGLSLETTGGVLDENLRNIGNATVATAASGVQKVGIVGATGTTLDSTAGVLDHNLKNIAGSAVSTSGSGTQKVGIVGNNALTLDGAPGGALPTNVIAIGVRAATANPNNLTDGTNANPMSDKAGRLVVTQGHVRDLVKSQTTTITASAAETIIVAAGAAGVFNDITQLIITSSGTAVANWALRDSTGGTNRAVFDTSATAGTSPLIIPFATSLPQTTSANNWTIQCSTGTSTGAHIFVEYIQNK